MNAVTSPRFHVIMLSAAKAETLQLLVPARDQLVQQALDAPFGAVCEGEQQHRAGWEKGSRGAFHRRRLHACRT